MAVVQVEFNLLTFGRTLSSQRDPFDFHFGFVEDIRCSSLRDLLWR